MDSTLRPTTAPRIIISLENCILPDFKFTCTPSFIDGLDPQYEYELRILGTELVQTSGILLKLPQVAMATGQVLFQRFYYSKSFVRHKMETTAMACTLLASKIEEAPRRIRDVVNVFNHMRQVRAGITPKPVLLDQEYINLKAEIIKAERRLLKELGFCVHVKHPHKFIVTLLQILDLKDNKQLIQTSWNYMNDSLRTDVFLRYLPETIACACIYLSANLLQIPLPANPAWYELFDASEADLEAICLAILKLYTQKKPDQTKLEEIIDVLRKQYENSRRPIEKKDVKNGENENLETKPRDMEDRPIEPEPKPSAISPKAVKEVYDKFKRRSPSYESSESPKPDTDLVNRPRTEKSHMISRNRDSYDRETSRRRRSPTNSHSKSQSRPKERSKDYSDYKSGKRHKEEYRERDYVRDYDRDYEKDHEREYDRDYKNDHKSDYKNDYKDDYNKHHTKGRSRSSKHSRQYNRDHH